MYIRRIIQFFALFSLTQILLFGEPLSFEDGKSFLDKFFSSIDVNDHQQVFQMVGFMEMPEKEAKLLWESGKRKYLDLTNLNKGMLVWFVSNEREAKVVYQLRNDNGQLGNIFALLNLFKGRKGTWNLKPSYKLKDYTDVDEFNLDKFKEKVKFDNDYHLKDTLIHYECFGGDTIEVKKARGGTRTVSSFEFSQKTVKNEVRVNADKQSSVSGRNSGSCCKEAGAKKEHLENQPQTSQ